MTYNYAKPTVLLTSSLAVLMMFSGMSYVFADDQNDFVSVNADRIKNDPVLAKILENIEKSRQEFSEIQQKTDQEKFIDERRTIAKNILEQEIAQMFKDNKDYTSLAAFNSFLKTVSDENTKTIFQGLFDYQQNKIDSAKTIMSDVLRNGGSLQAARDAYHDALQIPRSDMIQLVNDLNVQAGFSNPKIQDHFDEDGKLPRYESEQESIVSFVSLTTSAKNVNTSLKAETPVESVDEYKSKDTESKDTESKDTESKDTESKDTESKDTESKDTESKDTESKDTESKDTESKDVIESSNVDSKTENILIQELLDQIQFLKDKIADLEKNQNSKIQQAVLEQKTTESTLYADWVSNYYQGSGHKNAKMSDAQSIPVNALNRPNSYDDTLNSLTLGKLGQVTLGFSEPVTDKLIIYETSSEKNLQELAAIEVSVDGENWFLLKETQYRHGDSYVHEYIYDLSDIGCITQVKITDQSTSSSFGDGFDVDAIGASKLCTNPT